MSMWNCYIFYLLMFFVDVWISYFTLFCFRVYCFCVPKFICKNPMYDKFAVTISNCYTGIVV